MSFGLYSWDFDCLRVWGETIMPGWQMSLVFALVKRARLALAVTFFIDWGGVILLLLKLDDLLSVLLKTPSKTSLDSSDPSLFY
jgi:hypothetical protein